MTQAPSPAVDPTSAFTRQTLVKGQPTNVSCVKVCGKTFVINGGWLRVASLEDEWFEDLADPHATIAALRRLRGPSRPDIFTFWQRLPDTNACHAFHTEWEDIAVLPIQSYDHWWQKQIKARVRNQIRKSEKEGLVVKEVPYDNEFVRGMTAIFNETPVRQGRRFWHYGKSFETVKEQFSRYLYREHMIGAYHEGELVGFIMLANAGRYAITGQIISSIKHRDKSPNNALIAKAVELCEQKRLGFLVYLFWTEDSLAEFKRRCGFMPVKVPRYFVPLTRKGQLALACGAHRGWKAMVPARLKARLKALRSRWYDGRSR